MCMWFGHSCEIIFCHFFHFVNLVIFWPHCIDSGYLVSATPHTILYQSFLKLCTCFLHSLKMCMWFGYNPCINFCYIFHFANFVIFWPQILWKCCDSGYLVSATPHTILYRSFWNFAHVFTMVWRCAYGLDIVLELIFVTYSTLWTLSFWPQILWKCIDSGYLLRATPYTISCLSLCNSAHLFFHGLKMCMWFGFNPAVNFCHFSTLSFFAGATSTSPKFDLYFSHSVRYVMYPNFCFKLIGLCLLQNEMSTVL